MENRQLILPSLSPFPFLSLSLSLPSSARSLVAFASRTSFSTWQDFGRVNWPICHCRWTTSNRRCNCNNEPEKERKKERKEERKKQRERERESTRCHYAIPLGMGETLCRSLSYRLLSNLVSTPILRSYPSFSLPVGEEGGATDLIAFGRSPGHERII